MGTKIKRPDVNEIKSHIEGLSKMWICPSCGLDCGSTFEECCTKCGAKHLTEDTLAAILGDVPKLFEYVRAIEEKIEKHEKALPALREKIDAEHFATAALTRHGGATNDDEIHAEGKCEGLAFAIEALDEAMPS